MSTTLLWEIIIAIGVLILLAFIIGAFIITYALGKHSVRDTDERAYIHVDKDGHIRRPVVGKRVQTTEKGIAYLYSLDGKPTIIIVPNKYKQVRHYLGKRDLYVNKEGQLISSPFDGDTELSTLEKDDLFHSIFKSKMLQEAVRLISGKSKNNGLIMAIVICALILLVIFAGLGYYLGHQQAKPSAATQPTQTTQTTQPYIQPQGGK